MCFNKTRYRLIFPMILCLWFAAPVQAAQFHVTVGSEGKSVGSTITIPIEVTAEVTVGAAQLELLYDPERLRWVGGDAGKLTANTLIDANLLDAGRVKIAFAGGEDVQGKGTIYQARFEWTDSQTDATQIRFAGVRAWDQGTGLELATTASSGDAIPVIAIPVKPPNYPIYMAIAVVAFSLIAGLIIVLRKIARS